MGSNAGWQRYVIDPGALVYPKSVQVLGPSGTVSDPNGLTFAGRGVTTIHATAAGVPRLILDLGVETGGYVEVGVTKTDGTHVRLGYSELRQFLTPQGDTPSSSLGASDDPDGRTDVFATHARQAYRSPGIRGGERYIALQLEGAGTVSIDYVRVRVTHLRAPASGYGGYFYSSDRLLNRLWYAGAYTFSMDSFRDLRPGFGFSRTVVTDGAKRDRLIWSGDMAIENLLGDYSLRAAPGIIKNSLQAFSCLQLADGHLAPAVQIATLCPGTPPAAGTPFPPSAQPAIGAGLQLPEYTAWWIIGLHDYYLYTGDGGFARGMLPVVRRGLAYFQAHMAGGLFVTPASAINWHPFDTAAGADTHTNATVVRALHDAAEFERWLGRGTAAARVYDQRAASLRHAMLAQLWDSKAGAFVINPNDPLRNHTQDAQVEAVLDGVTNGSQSRRALRFITMHLARQLGVANGEYLNDPYMSNYISPYISSTELLARLENGQPTAALSLIRREWGHMLAAGPGTLWEKVGFDGLPANYSPLQRPTPFFAPNGAGATSLAHGWSGGPVPALSGYIVGIRPTAPGYRSWIVAPQLGDLRFAQGQAPTPHGPIASLWERGPNNSLFKLTVIAPRRTTGVVEVPLLGQPRAIALDGHIVWDGRHATAGAKGRAINGVIEFSNIRGEHTFAWAESAGGQP
ncbi:MAG TPA: alpha-L-rhamnosidase C-terminal domain-containing protein [Solirubrobacteraceae bacterium]